MGEMTSQIQLVAMIGDLKIHIGASLMYIHSHNFPGVIGIHTRYSFADHARLKCVATKLSTWICRAKNLL